MWSSIYLYASLQIPSWYVSNHCTSNVWAGVIVVWGVKGPDTRGQKEWITLIFKWKSANASLQCSHIYDVLLIPISSLLYSVVCSDHGCGSWCCPGPRLTARVRCWPLSQPSLRAAPASSEAPANNHLYHTRSYTQLHHTLDTATLLRFLRPKYCLYCDLRLQYLLYQLHILWQEVEFKLKSSTKSSKHS